MDSTVTEGWVEWAIGMVVVGVRIFARFKIVGFRWQGDDYLAILSALCFTGVFVTTVVQRPRGSNVGLTDEQRAALTPEQIKPMVEGSKAILAALYIYATGLWSMKGQMLFLYHRFTLGLWQQKMVKVVAVICAIFYMTIILVTSCRCLPIRKTWQVYPDPGESCTTSIVYYLVTELSNQVSDLMLFAIPAPILLKVNIPWTRKLLIGSLLSSGLFVFVVSIIRLVLTLGDISHMSTLAIWAIREMFVAILCVNAPAIKPLFSPSRWLRSTGNSGSGGRKYTPNSGSGHVVLRDMPKDAYPITNISNYSPKGSAEEIFAGSSKGVNGNDHDALPEPARIEIHRTTEVEVKSWDPTDRDPPGKPW